MTTWTKPRLLCLPDTETTTARCTCAHQDYRHAATYCAELINADTGDVERRSMCFERGRVFAEKHHLEFPPWRDQEPTR